MTVKQMIERLKQFDENLEVAISDWGEQYHFPSLKQTQYIKVQRTRTNEDVLRSIFDKKMILVIGDNE